MTSRRRAMRVLAVATAIGAACEALAVPARLAENYYTSQEIAQHRDYVRPKYARWAIGEVVAAGFLVLFVAVGLHRRLRKACDRLVGGGGSTESTPRSRAARVVERLWGDASWKGAVLFVFLFCTMLEIVWLPESFYFDWLRERRHGVSVESFGRFVWDWARGASLGVAATSALAFGLYGLARRTRRWWLWLGAPCAVMLLGAGVIDPYRTRLYFDDVPLPDGPARQAIAATLRRANLEFEGVYAVQVSDVTRRANASIEGQGPSRRIVLWDTLLASLTPDELAGAVAHEAGHIVDRSPTRLALASAALLPVLALLAWALRAAARRPRLRLESDADVASLPIVLLFVGLLQLATGPVGSAWARHLERRADRFALELLQSPEAYRSMLVKVGRINLVDLDPPRWTRWALLSHPPVLDRIAEVEMFARERGLTLVEPRPGLFAAGLFRPGSPKE